MKRLYTVIFVFLTISIHINISAQPCPLSCLPEGAVYEMSPLFYPKGLAKFTTITSQIPGMADIGVKTIYLMPVFKESGVPISASDSVRFRNAYDIEDYYQLDPYYGSDADLQNMIDTAHVYGIRVLFDLVLNHTYYPSIFMDSAWDYRVTSTRLADTASALGYPVKYDTIGGQVFPYINKQYVGNDSTYSFRGWIDSSGIIHVMHYPTWRWWFGIDYTNPGLIRYIVNLSKYFIAHFNFDGWRLDAPSDNTNPYLFSGNHSMLTLLQTVKDSMTAIKPSCVLISECAHSGRLSSATNDFDQMVEASYDANYALNVLATSGAAKLPSYIVSNLLLQIGKENILYNRSRLRFSENHDSPRINAYASMLNFPLLVFNATIFPGIPMIQAGQETGATTQLYSIPTSGFDTAQIRVRNFYRKVFHLRNAFSALKYGSLQDVQLTTTGDSSKVYSFIRDSGSEQILVIVNFDTIPVTTTLKLPYTAGTVLYDSLSTDSFTVITPSSFSVKVPAYGSMILVPNTISTGIDTIKKQLLNSYIYPNPFDVSATIQINIPIHNTKINIYNIYGQKVKEINNASGYSIPIKRDNLSPGVYFYEMLQSNKIISKGKLVVTD